jgi:hypothetical protein
MIIKHPTSAVGCILKMLPSFYPAEDLKALGAVIRYYLLMDCDDYGRVRVDAKKLHGQLGPAITKRVSMKDIEQELARMQRTGHLILFNRKKGVFGYLRDAAQHLMKKKRYDRQIPQLYTDREFTYDSNEFKAFFKAIAEQSAGQDKVFVNSFSERGDVTVVSERVPVAAERYLKHYEKTISKEPYCNLTPEQFCGFGDDAFFDYYNIVHGIQFFHGFKTGLSAEMMECLYLSDPEYFDGTGSHPDDHRILAHLIGMKPREYVSLLKAREAASTTPYEGKGNPLVVPGDPDNEAGENAGDDNVPEFVPHDEDTPTIVPETQFF